MLDAAEGELWSTVEPAEAPLEIPEELLEELVPMASMSQVANFAAQLVKAKKEKPLVVPERPPEKVRERAESLGVPSETSVGTGQELRGVCGLCFEPLRCVGGGASGHSEPLEPVTGKT